MIDSKPYALPAAQYEDLNSSPAHLRKLDDALLNLEQINLLNRRAVELGTWRNNGFGDVHEPNEMEARAEFRLVNHIENGQWLEGGTDEVKPKKVKK